VFVELAGSSSQLHRAKNVQRRVAGRVDVDTVDQR